MTDVFDYAVNQVFGEEGGYVDDPNDPGGATNMGITLNTLSLWRNTPCTKDDVKNLSNEEAKKIYRSLYWNKIHGDDLKPAVALLLFDAAVNHGVGGAIKIAQRAMHVQDDGVIGPQTIKAFFRADPHDFIADFMTERSILYMTLSGFGRYGRGWMHRLFSCTTEAANFIVVN